MGTSFTCGCDLCSNDTVGLRSRRFFGAEWFQMLEMMGY
jgi:hypothetical protein